MPWVTHRPCADYTTDARSKAMGTDWLILPQDGDDMACHRYRMQAPDGTIWRVNLPEQHVMVWGK